ncbi:MAG TPA: DUF6326 family protein [Rhodanobacteraceae bacterium]|jgi:hypothetical protein|nr:DUF6326 family protein [Rhodanobacteraceae bacterium]
MPRTNALQHFDPPVQLKLSALWASVMLCYIYGDYFGLFVPGTLKAMLEGQMGSLGPTTQGVLLGTSALITFPALMVALSLLLPPTVNRWLNILLGLVYTAIVLFFMAGGWWFYEALAIVEIILQLLVVWHAWKWPKVPAIAGEDVPANPYRGATSAP